MAGQLRKAGYRLTEGRDSEPVIISDALDTTVLTSVAKGGHALILVDSSTKLPAGFPGAIVSRDSPWYDGNWATIFHWLRNTQAPFSQVQFGKHLGFEAERVMPYYLIAGLSSVDFPKIPAGSFIGWLHLNSGYLVPVRYGKGVLVLCTLRVGSAIQDDPYAATLFPALVRYTMRNEATLGWK